MLKSVRVTPYKTAEGRGLRDHFDIPSYKALTYVFRAVSLKAVWAELEQEGFFPLATDSFGNPIGFPGYQAGTLEAALRFLGEPPPRKKPKVFKSGRVLGFQVKISE